MKKIYIMIPILLFVVCVVFGVFIFINNDVEKLQNNGEENSLSTTMHSDQGTENVNVSVSVQEKMSAEDNLKSTATQFTYVLKETYKSRNEIKQELDSLERAYYNFIVNKDTETKNAAEKKYIECEKILFEWLNRFSPDDEEILKEKEHLLDQKVFFDKEDLFMVEKTFDKYPPDTAKEKLEYAKKEYEHSCSVSEAYENGEITIDEALEKLGIVYENK